MKRSENIGTIVPAIAESAKVGGWKPINSTHRRVWPAASAKNILFLCENPPKSRYFSARDRKQLSRRELACSSKLHTTDARVDREEQMFIYYLFIDALLSVHRT